MCVCVCVCAKKSRIEIWWMMKIYRPLSLPSIYSGPLFMLIFHVYTWYKSHRSNFGQRFNENTNNYFRSFLGFTYESTSTQAHLVCTLLNHTRKPFRNPFFWFLFFSYMNFIQTFRLCTLEISDHHFISLQSRILTMKNKSFSSGVQCSN